jgi:hypothetical protein
MKISIFGDSFSSDRGPDSWIDLLVGEHVISNYSQRGVSEFRIHRTLSQQIDRISQSDVVIVFHTNPDRVYVPDQTLTPSRQISTHPVCDMLVSDSLEKWSPAEIYYKHFYDQEFQDTLYGFIVNDIRLKCQHVKLLEFSGFDTEIERIYSIKYLRDQYPGKINHLDIVGNMTVAKLIEDQLR